MKEQAWSEIASNPEFYRAERGLFPIDQGADRKSPATPPSGWRKNEDFLRLKDIALYLVDPRPGLEMLEIGCAVGAQLVTCGLLGVIVYGQDLDPERVAQANAKLRRLSLTGEARAGDARTLHFEDDRFDVVLSSDFLEHLTAPDQSAVLAEALRVLKPGGHLVIKTPNAAYLRAALTYKRIRAVTQLRSPAGWVIPHTDGTGPDDHVGLLTRSSLTSRLLTAGFQTMTFHYAPLRRFGARRSIEILSTEIPVLRDMLCEDLFCRAFKPVALSLFPE